MSVEIIILGTHILNQFYSRLTIEIPMSSIEQCLWILWWELSREFTPQKFMINEKD